MSVAEHIEIDPITFEVVRHKLQAISEEQAITLKSVSGSPIVTEATDFNNGLYLADGSIVTMGPQVLFHSGTMSSVIRHIVSEYSERPGIHEGDMFILNDPYRGAVHQPDVSIVAPVFYEGEHVAWAGACAHQLDVGGMNFSSWAIKATEIQQEAMLLPGIKIVENGEIREDIWQMIMGMTRLPQMIGLDFKAMIAANHVATKRLCEVMDRYGADVVNAVMRAEIDASEQQLRAKLREFPDGVFRAVDFIDHDGHENRLYEIRLALHKQGDELIFDLEGSSPQAPGFINCTRAGLIGALFTGVLPILAPDIRWNEGILRPVTVKAPEGVICNATWPAPVSGGTIGAVFVCTSLAVRTLSALAACSTATSSEAIAVTKGSFMVLTLAGLDRDGGPFGTLLMDAMLAGGGAYADHDGLDASGDFDIPRPAVANVEQHEVGGPLLYLYRRFLQDTAGPGRMRGGATVSLAVTPHDVDSLHAMLIGHGVEVPNTWGLFGGLEGSCNEALLIRDCGGPDEILALAGRHEDAAKAEGAEWLGSKPGFFDLRQGDVFAYSFQGGGGFGDPLEREPARVQRDVEEGFVSVESARRHYGVIVDDGAIDPHATDLRRSEIRTERLGHEPEKEAGGATPEEGEFEAGFTLLISPGGRVRCRCGQTLVEEGNWKDGAQSRTVAPDEHGFHIRLHEELELREHVCPSCGTLLEAEVARKGAPNLDSIQLER